MHKATPTHTYHLMHHAYGIQPAYTMQVALQWQNRFFPPWKGRKTLTADSYTKIFDVKTFPKTENRKPIIFSNWGINLYGGSTSMGACGKLREPVFRTIFGQNRNTNKEALDGIPKKQWNRRNTEFYGVAERTLFLFFSSFFYKKIIPKYWSIGITKAE